MLTYRHITKQEVAMKIIDIQQELNSMKDVEKTYENFVTSYYCGDTTTHMAFCWATPDKSLINKFCNRLFKEQKLLGE